MIAFKRIISAAFLAIFMACLLAASGFAQDNAEVMTEEEAKANFEKDKTGTNPINFTYDARLYNEFQWLNTAGGGDHNITTFEFRFPFADGKWQFRSKIRGQWLNTDLTNDGSDDVNESGLGDTDIRFMTVPYINMEKKLGMALGFEFFLPTASENALGTGATTLGPLVFLPFFNPVGPGSIFVPGYQHKFSVSEADGRSQVHQGLIDLFLVKTFAGNQFWGYIDPQIVLDYENDNQFMLLEIQGGAMLDKLFGTKGHSAWLLPSFGVGGDRPYDFSIEVGYKIVW